MTSMSNAIVECGRIIKRHVLEVHCHWFVAPDGSTNRIDRNRMASGAISLAINAQILACITSAYS